ncbi:MAG: GFA family protein [Gammaproteobacteria bacterium]|nr:GFA family protein [Gammaproteobacteria bacterium]
MEIEGGCHCGKVSYKATVNPNNVLLCHCADCQVMSGGPYRTIVPTREDNFELDGPTRTYIKTADSGNQRTCVFCPECGTGIYGSSVGDGAKIIGIRGGTVRQIAQLPPQRQIWCGSAMPWLGQVDSIDSVNGQP